MIIYPNIMRATYCFFEYQNNYGSGGFVVSEVSDWARPEGHEYYQINLKNGKTHLVSPGEFGRLRPLLQKFGG